MNGPSLHEMSITSFLRGEKKNTFFFPIILIGEQMETVCRPAQHLQQEADRGVLRKG